MTSQESLAATSFPGSLSFSSLAVQIAKEREPGIEVAYTSPQLFTCRGLCKYEKDSGQAIHIIGDQQLFSPYNIGAFINQRTGGLNKEDHQNNDVLIYHQILVTDT